MKDELKPERTFVKRMNRLSLLLGLSMQAAKEVRDSH